MGYLENLLGRNERIAFITRQHWIVLLGSFLANTLIALVIAALVIVLSLVLPRVFPIALILLLLLIIPLVRLGIRLLTWWHEQYIITNRRVVQTEGLFNKHVIDSSLEKVNDVVLNQSTLGRILGYGDIDILTASEIGVNRLERISGPFRFKTKMLNQKEDMGLLDEFGNREDRILESPPPTAGDVPELIAELDELRTKGIISEAEFEQKKQELLRKI